MHEGALRRRNTLPGTYLRHVNRLLRLGCLLAPTHLLLLHPHLLFLLLALLLLLLEDLEQHGALLIGRQRHQLLLHGWRQCGVKGGQLLLQLLLLHHLRLRLGSGLGSRLGGGGRLLLLHALCVQLLDVLQLLLRRQLGKLVLHLQWQAGYQLLHHHLLLLLVEVGEVGGTRRRLLLLALLQKLLHHHLTHVGRHVGQLGSNGGVHGLLHRQRWRGQRAQRCR